MVECPTMFIRIVGMYTVMNTPKRRRPRTTFSVFTKRSWIDNWDEHENAERRKKNAFDWFWFPLVIYYLDFYCGVVLRQLHRGLPMNGSNQLKKWNYFEFIAFKAYFGLVSRPNRWSLALLFGILWWSYQHPDKKRHGTAMYQFCQLLVTTWWRSLPDEVLSELTVPRVSLIIWNQGQLNIA